MKIMFSSQRHSLLLLAGILISPLSLSAILQEELSQLIHDVKQVYLNHKSLNSNQIEQINTTISSVIDAVTAGKLTIDVQTILAGTTRDLSFDQDNESLRVQTLKLREKLYALESAKFFKDVEFKKDVEIEGSLTVTDLVVLNCVDNLCINNLSVDNEIINCDLTVGCNINMNDSINPAVGNIFKNGDSFIHNFGTNNTFLGVEAGNFSMSGRYNTGTGAFALTSNQDGFYNTASGLTALAANQNGSVNVAIGAIALVSNIDEDANTAIGFISMPSNIGGNGNTAVGIASLVNNTFGDDNTAIGAGALSTNTTGNNNTAIGENALELSTGSGNVALGVNAGSALTTGNNNIYIAHGGVSSESNTTRIGLAQTRTFVAGVYGITTGSATTLPVIVDLNGQLGTAPSSRRFKHSIQDMNADSANIYHLDPVSFVYNGDATNKSNMV